MAKNRGPGPGAGSSNDKGEGIELDRPERRSGDDQSQAGQKRGGGDPPRRVDSDSAKEGIDGQNHDDRNGEGLGRI